MYSVRNLLWCVFVIACLFGCTTFTHATKEPGEFGRDRKECERYVAEHPGEFGTCSVESPTCATCEEVKECLEALKGWKRVRN
jgi:hypothetical protein